MRLGPKLPPEGRRQKVWRRETFLGSHLLERELTFGEGLEMQTCPGLEEADHVLGVGFFLRRAQGLVQYQARFGARNRYKFG